MYFTWPDRRLRHVCAGCGACCKGQGLGFDVAGGELVQLLARRPALTAFLRPRGDTVTAFNPRQGCWFLAEDGLCRVEVEDGRAAKPASCRLFPFNRVFRIGAYTVVDYNSVLCPLTVAPPGAPDAIAHAAVLADIATIQDPNLVGARLPALDPEREGKALVEGERAIAAALFGAPGDLERAWGAQADAAALDSEAAIASAAFEALLDVPWRAPSAATLAAATWATPSLRFNELYGPRQYAARSAMAPVLARMWLAWLGFAALGEELAQRPLGLQDLSALWSEQAPLLHVIARWREAPTLRPDAVELPAIDPDHLVRELAQAFVANRQAQRPLSALIAALPGAPALRITALKAAEAVVRAAYAR